MTNDAPATDRVLHNYFRSSSAYRVRIALNLKGLPYEYVPVHLTRGGGEQFAPARRGAGQDDGRQAADRHGHLGAGKLKAGEGASV